MKWAAMFSVAGGPYEELDRHEDKQEMLDAIKEESYNWSCRTHGFVKEVNDNEANNDNDTA